MLDMIKNIFSQQEFISTFSSLFIIILIGFLARKTNLLPEQSSDILSKLMVKIIVPALTITVFMEDISSQRLKAGLSIFVLSFILYGSFLFLTRFLYPNKTQEERTVLSNMTTFSSNSLFGLPIIYAFFGESAVMLANIFNIPYRLLIFTYGQGSLSHSSSDKRMDWRQIFANPVTILTLVGFTLWVFQNSLPQISIDGQFYSIFRIDQTAYWLYLPLHMLASLLSPLAWLLIGIQLAEMKVSTFYRKKEAWYFSLMKLGLVPLLTLFLSSFIYQAALLPLSKASIAIATLLMATPTSTMLVVFAIEGKQAVQTVSLGTLQSTLLSMLALPLWLVILKLLQFI